MAKFISRARKLRFELQAKLGRQVTIEEVAGAIGVDRRVVMKFERNEMQRIDDPTQWWGRWVVPGTGDDPVTSCFSDTRSTN